MVSKNVRAGYGQNGLRAIFLGNASLFTKWLFTFLALLYPPLNQQSDGFALESVLKGPQIELRTRNKNCEKTLLIVQANKVMNKWVFLIFALKPLDFLADFGARNWGTSQ